ncbi:hypothetical protein ACFU7T_26655 [Streptomyces sp. NPDC057555]|uniref:hypothetical protein n=1 Tax=Streptomyces sp. NPDC057555 TaxID=3346166 RepID=UPI0036AC6AD6
MSSHSPFAGCGIHPHPFAIPAEDLAAACTYLVGEDLITVDWTAGNTPAMVTLTHQGIRCMEAEEEERS